MGGAAGHPRSVSQPGATRAAPSHLARPSRERPGWRCQHTPHHIPTTHPTAHPHAVGLRSLVQGGASVQGSGRTSVRSSRNLAHSVSTPLKSKRPAERTQLVIIMVGGPVPLAVCSQSRHRHCSLGLPLCCMSVGGLGRACWRLPGAGMGTWQGARCWEAVPCPCSASR